MIVTNNKVRLASALGMVLVVLIVFTGLAYQGGTVEKCAASCPGAMESFNWGVCRCFAPGFVGNVQNVPITSQSLSLGGSDSNFNGQPSVKFNGANDGLVHSTGSGFVIIPGTHNPEVVHTGKVQNLGGFWAFH